jgi:hypothetical protein
VAADRYTVPPRDSFTPRPAKSAKRRRLPRLKTELITCELGEVIDLSLAGFCVRTARAMKIGDVHVLAIQGFDQVAGPLQTTVVWCDQGKIGLRITKAAKTARKVVSDIAMMARDRRAFDKI